MDNHTIAQHLQEYADHLESLGGNLYRARAFRRAAEAILGLDVPAEEILDHKGPKGLQELPGIGSHIAATIDLLVRTGEFRTLKSRQPRLGASYVPGFPGIPRQAHTV